MTFVDIKKALRKEIDPARAKASSWFFKTGKGQYGYGDKFLGVSVPKQRAIAKMHKDLILSDVIRLMHSPWHEERLTALFILVLQFQNGEDKTKREIYNLYLANTKYVNNWDLVDSSAPYILGPYLLKRDRPMLYRLARSNNLWERRMAIVTTYHFIRNGQLEDTFKIAESLLNDTHDLIHKAAGWMLRESGKRDIKALESFLDKHAHVMPRTMLRYATEKFPPAKRTIYIMKK